MGDVGVERSELVEGELLFVLLFALPVPLVDLGEGDLDQIREVLDLFVGPVGISEVAQLKTRSLSLIESDPGLLDDRSPALFLRGDVLLNQRQRLQRGQFPERLQTTPPS